MSNESREAPPNVPWRTKPSRSRPIWGPILLVLVCLAAILGPAFVWFFCRIEPRAGQIAILIHKTGKDLPSGQILALEPGQKGILTNVLSEGRFFKNPYSWGWRYANIVDIPAGKLGVLTRLFGDPLPPGEILAREGTKGILADTLAPGRHRINPYAYAVETFDAITIPPGSVGVVTALTGKDILNSELPEAKRSTFLVEPGMKGVLPEVLEPGTYYLNPYVVNVNEVSLQSQRFAMSGDDAISFLTMDGFTVVVEGTLEFAIIRDKAAWITHRVGDMEDVLKKVILPRARGFSRIEGSKQPANNFIVGETRQQFQNNLETHLRTTCEPWGVALRSVLVRNIQPPEEISSIIRDREVAVQTAAMYTQQMAQARSQANLTEQQMLATQNTEKITAQTEQLRSIILARQQQSVALTAASQQLSVAKIELEAAAFQAQAVIAQAEASKDVIAMSNTAEAAVFAQRADAFGGGMNFARYTMYQKVAPRIGAVLTGDGRDGFGDIFRAFLPEETPPVAARPPAKPAGRPAAAAPPAPAPATPAAPAVEKEVRP